MSFTESVIQVLWVLGFLLMVIGQVLVWAAMYVLPILVLGFVGVLAYELFAMRDRLIASGVVSFVYGVFAVSLYVWWVSNFSAIDLYVMFYN